jgi:hypothetical protein
MTKAMRHRCRNPHYHKAPGVNSSWASVYDGRECIGHILSRGPEGYEAYDRDDKSLGFFKSRETAAHALVGANP